MTDDLVKRLHKGPLRDDYETAVTMSEAADRIEKLEEALREIAASAWDCNGKTCEHCRPNSCQNAFIARKALEGKDG